MCWVDKIRCLLFDDCKMLVNSRDAATDIGFYHLPTPESPSLDLQWSEGNDWVTNISDARYTSIISTFPFGNSVNCCKLTCQLLAHNLQAVLSSSRFEHQPNPRLSDRQFPEVMFSPYKFLFSMVLIQFHFLEEFKCLKTKVVWYENPGLPASRRARTPSDARGACSIVCRIPRRAPNISTSFTILHRTPSS